MVVNHLSGLDGEVKFQRERRTFGQPASNMYLSFMVLYNPFSNGKSKSHTHLFGRDERIKYL